MVFDTCFFCEAYVHDGVNLEVCGMDGHDVSFDTPKCAQFSPATTKESKFSKLFKREPITASEFLEPDEDQI